MLSKLDRTRRTGFGLLLALATISLGCGVSETLRTAATSEPADTVFLPFRTPWPTFTPSPGAAVASSSDGTDGQDAVAPGERATPTQEATRPPTNTPLPFPPPPTHTRPLSTNTPPPPTNTPLPPTNTPLPPTNTPAPPPPPAPTPVPPPTQPQYQFSPAPWYAGERNDAIVRFYGYLKDTSGNSVDGYSVKANCGDFSVLSFPSGPSPVAPNWAPGWYDIVFPNPISCNFTLQVVAYQCNTPGFFDAQCKEFETLSEAVPVVTDVAAGETVIVADWIKNW